MFFILKQSQYLMDTHAPLAINIAPAEWQIRAKCLPQYQKIIKKWHNLRAIHVFASYFSHRTCMNCPVTFKENVDVVSFTVYARVY